jgi:hypothetical protein
VEARLASAAPPAPEDLGRLERPAFLRFAVATGDDPYLERAARWPADRPLVAPLLYLPGILHWTPGPLEAELHPDGLAPRDAPGVEPDDPVTVMHGGQSIGFAGPVLEGMRVAADRGAPSVRRVRGRSTDFLLVVTETRFVADGTPLLALEDTILVVPR